MGQGLWEASGTYPAKLNPSTPPPPPGYKLIFFPYVYTRFIYTLKKSVKGNGDIVNKDIVNTQNSTPHSGWKDVYLTVSWKIMETH